MIIGLLNSYFAPKVLEGAQCFCSEKGIRLDTRWALKSEDVPSNLDWDGVITNLNEPLSPVYRQFAYLPSVATGGVSLGTGPLALRVRNDWAEAGRMMGQEMARLGVRTVLTRRPEPTLARFSEFFNGLKAELNNYPEVTLATPAKARSAFGSLGEYLVAFSRWVVKHATEGERIGLALINANIAYSVEEVILARGLKIPEDLKIIAIDKDPQRTVELAPVPLTSVELDEWMVGYQAAKLLYKRLRNRNDFEPVVVVKPVNLVRRESTGGLARGDAHVDRAIQIIEEQAGSGIKAQEVIDHLGVSRRAMEQRFRTATGTSIQKFIQDKRLAVACELLETTDKSHHEIARMSGFSSLFYFANVFKRAKKVPPGKWRKMYRRKMADNPGGEKG